MKYDLIHVTTPADAEKYRELGCWKDETLYGKFRKAADRNPDKTAIICGTRKLTFAEVRRQVDNLAGNLVKLGIQREEIVAAQFPNSPEIPIIHLALNRIGALFMPLHDGFREMELTHLLNKAGAVTVIVTHQHRNHNYSETYQKLRGELPTVRHIFTTGGHGSGTAPFEALLEPSGVSENDLDQRQSKPDELAHIMLSSGTTSLPKISLFTNNNIMAMMGALESMIHLSAADTSAALAPMGTGATGYVFPVLPPLLLGGTSIILEHWSDPAVAVDLIVDAGCTYATAIPTQMTLMAPVIEKRPTSDFDKFRRFNNGGAPLPYDVARKIEEIMNCRVQAVYGSTDGGAPCMVSIDDSIEKRLSTVGRALPGRTVELRDPSGKPAAAGEAGEICWRSPDKSYGYLNDLEASRAAFGEDGFYRSGDLGKFDADGYLSIVGRVKDMILRGGRNISPRLIEEMLIAHPAIAEIAVAAMPSRTLGEQACAFVVLTKGHQLSFEEAVAFLTEKKIAKWQLPERLEIMDELPKSTGGKIAKNKLTELVTAKLQQEMGAEA